MSRRLSRKPFLNALGAIGALVSASAPLIARADAYTMRLNLPSSIDSVAGIAAARLATQVHRRSNGQLKIEIYPSMQLANEASSFDALATGVIDLGIVNTAFFAQALPQYQVLDLPFLFKDFATTYRVLDGPIGQELFGALEPRGILVLGYGSPGFKEIETTNRAVVVPEDMKGLRLRVPNSAILIAAYQALGAIPIVIDFTETFVALQQHTVDAIEISIDNMITAKYYTVTKHLALTNHVCIVVPLVASKRKVEALPPDLQTILKQEARAVLPFWRSLSAQAIAKSIQFLKSNGVATTDIRYPAFHKTVEPVYAMLQSKLSGDLIDRVVRATNA